MKIIGWFFIVGLVVGTLTGADVLYGRLSEVSLVRQDALNFRNEAAYTIFSTKNIVPGTDHTYRFPYRDEGAELLATGEPRRFRSNTAGAVEPVQVADEGVPTIVFLGGSTTENNEVDEPFRFPGRVGEVLRENGMNASTINFGVRGHTTIDSINVLINRSHDLGADYVVLMHNINDRFRSASDRGYMAKPGSERVSSAETVTNAIRHLLTAVWDYVSYRSNALFTIRFNENINDAFRGDDGRKNSTAGNIIVPVGGRNKPNEEAFANNLQIFLQAARVYDIEPIFMTQPLGYFDADHESFNNVIREVASSEDLWLIDMSAGIGDEPHWAFLSDGIHFNNMGSIAASEIIATALSERIWGRKTASVADDRHEVVAPSELANRCTTKGDGKYRPGKPWYLGEIEGRYPSVSEDGNWLLYQERVASADRIRFVDLSSGEIHRIAPEEAGISERHPAFVEATRQTLRIVYGKGAEDERPEKIESLIELAWPEMIRRTLTPPGMSASIPAVSDGRIVFAGSKGKAPDLYESDLETGAIARLTFTEWEEWRPVFSPSGTLYFISNHENNFDLYKRETNGSVHIVWRSPADEWDPAVSSIGDLLAFASRRTGSWNIYTLSLGGPKAEPVQITTGSGNKWDPSFVDIWGMLIYAKSEFGSSKLMGVCLYSE